MTYARQVWVDDDGSGTVGTQYTAARMNNIEEGILASRVAIDKSVKATAGTGNLEWTHAVVSEHIKGVVVFIVQDVTAADQVSGVTYGGTAMEEVSGSPFLHTLGSEDAALYCYFLGKNVPKGSSTVAVTVTGAAVKSAISISLLGPKDCDLRIFNNAAPTNESASAKEAGVGVFEELGAEPLALAAFHLGSAEVSELTPLAGRTEILASHDFGAAVAAYTTGVKPNDTTGVAQITQASADEFGAIAVQVAPVRNWGLVTALPTRAGKGDTCSYIADKSNGVIWQLIYDGEGEFPWKKIGGPEMLATDDTERNLTNTTTYTSLTSPLELTVPLKGDYDISIDCFMNHSAAGVTGNLSFAIGATTASDNWSAMNTAAGAANGGDGFKKTRKTCAASDKIIEKAKTAAAGTTAYRRRRLRLDPVRVG